MRHTAIFWQLVAVAVIAAGGMWLFGNILDNLDNRGIASGFSFLKSTAGFGISTSLIDFTEASSIGRAFWVGLLNTLMVSAIGVVLATILGFAVGIARFSNNWLLARLAMGFVETLRNIPLLLQIFFWYFAVLRSLPGPRQSYDIAGLAYLNNRGFYIPKLEFFDGSGWSVVGIVILAVAAFCLRRHRVVPRISVVLAVLILVFLLVSASVSVPALKGFNFTGGSVLSPEFVALVIALSSYTAAFIAEIVRAGIQSVPRGQIEAADALALSAKDRMRFVVIPQALRVIVPLLTNQYLNLTKNSSLAAAIAFPDLVSVFAGTALNITGQAIEIIGITMAVYLTISLLIAFAMNAFNRATAMRGLSTG
ncbi:MAG: amino acid ABC transporter permease [Alphaproteobacteria bacterium]